MRTALNLLFDIKTSEEARELIQDESARQVFSATIQDMPSGDAGYLDNLLMGVIALRVKFPREEATAKLELNLTMRGQRR